MQNAIFHQGSYYLLPGEFTTCEAFMTDLRSRELPAAFRLRLLKEENRITDSGKVVPGFCMAPCFLSGYRDWYRDVRIDSPDDVYPAEAAFISLTEYDQR